MSTKCECDPPGTVLAAQAELHVAEIQAGRARLPKLGGESNQYALATISRHNLIVAARLLYLDDVPSFTKDILEPSRQIRSSSWWIRHAKHDAARFRVALLEATAELRNGSGC